MTRHYGISCLIIDNNGNREYITIMEDQSFVSILKMDDFIYSNFSDKPEDNNEITEEIAQNILIQSLKDKSIFLSAIYFCVLQHSIDFDINNKYYLYRHYWH
jgi:hypothetical protein